MKFRVRLKIAYDMCIKQLFAFRISTILFAITLTIFGIIIYQYKASYNYRLMVEKGFNKPLSEVYYLSSELNHSSENDYPDISNVEGMELPVSHQISYNTAPCLQFLNEISNKQNNGSQGIEEAWIFSNNFNMYNVRLIEGKEPAELNSYDGIPIYLSEEYKSITNLYEHYQDYDGDKLVNDYYLAGYFSSDSVIPNPNVTSTNMGGTIEMKYVMIELAGMIDPFGYFTVKDGYTINDVMEGIRKEYAKSNSIAYITNVDSALTCMEKNIDKSLKYLILAAILLTGTSIISLLVIQIGNILTRGKEYGVWLICNATDRDILKILILQNAIRLIYAEIMAFLFVNLITRLLLYGENFAKSDLSQKISNRIIALNIYPVIIIVGLFIAGITVIVPAIKLSRTEPIKLIRGEL